MNFAQSPRNTPHSATFPSIFSLLIQSAYPLIKQILWSINKSINRRSTKAFTTLSCGTPSCTACAFICPAADGLPATVSSMSNVWSGTCSGAMTGTDKRRCPHRLLLLSVHATVSYFSDISRFGSTRLPKSPHPHMITFTVFSPCFLSASRKMNSNVGIKPHPYVCFWHESGHSHYPLLSSHTQKYLYKTAQNHP